MTRPAWGAISELLAEDVVAAAVEFITGPLLEAPYRVGQPLRDTMSGFRSARLGTQRRAGPPPDADTYRGAASPASSSLLVAVLVWPVAIASWKRQVRRA